jgi:ketosteroid isomerase-like protein
MSAADNKRLVRRVFDAMRSGDPELPDLLAADVTWWAPPSSSVAGLHSGKHAVLELMQNRGAPYGASEPGDASIEQMTVEDDWVSVQMTLGAQSAAGDEARNHYRFAFRVGDGRIHEVREHLDTMYAQLKLF